MANFTRWYLISCNIGPVGVRILRDFRSIPVSSANNSAVLLLPVVLKCNKIQVLLGRRTKTIISLINYTVWLKCGRREKSGIYVVEALSMIVACWKIRREFDTSIDKKTNRARVRNIGQSLMHICCLICKRCKKSKSDFLVSRYKFYFVDIPTYYRKHQQHEIFTPNIGQTACHVCFCTNMTLSSSVEHHF